MKSIILFLIGLAICTLQAGEFDSSLPWNAPSNKSSLSGGLWDAGRADSHAPIGVMGDHTHSAGEFMFSFRTMLMHMEEMRDGSSGLSNTDVFARGYMVTPTEMDMEMHMLGVMYAPTESLTLMAMGNYQYTTMDHLRANGTSFRQDTEGWGDLEMSALLRVYNQNKQRVHLNLGFSAPTGEFSNRAYPMHNTTGTWDLLPGITWLWQGDLLSGGAQVKGRIHLDDNRRGFAYGDSVVGTTWVAYPLSEELSISARVIAEWKDEIDGIDENISGPMFMSPPMSPENHGGTWFESAIGLNYYAKSGFLKGHRLGVEFTLPIYQDLNGPQLERNIGLTLGWQKAF